MTFFIKAKSSLRFSFGLAKIDTNLGYCTPFCLRRGHLSALAQAGVGLYIQALVTFRLFTLSLPLTVSNSGKKRSSGFCVRWTEFPALRFNAAASVHVTARQLAQLWESYFRTVTSMHGLFLSEEEKPFLEDRSHPPPPFRLSSGLIAQDWVI